VLGNVVVVVVMTTPTGPGTTGPGRAEGQMPR